MELQEVPTSTESGLLAKTKKTGVRARAKVERQDRIMLAARKLFAEQGYDGTTLRQIAEDAGLGLGTLFNYISDKRDLIYLVFNQEVSVVTDVTLAAPRPWQTFNEKILSMIEPFFRFFGSEPVLSRILLSEVLQHTPGFHLAEYMRNRNRYIKGVEEIVASAQRTGEITSSASPELVARHIFFILSSALRWWLAASENPHWRSGMRDFAELLKLQTSGLGLQTAAMRNDRNDAKDVAARSKGSERSYTTAPARTKVQSRVC